MTGTKQICLLKDSADIILWRMSAGRFRHMPFIEDNLLIGLITIGELVKNKLTELAVENETFEIIFKGY